jgi:hypothetical protein
MTNKEFAILNDIDEYEADVILNWFLENFNEKDIETVVDILINAVKESAATIHNLRDACLEIKIINSDYNDLGIIEDLKRMANYGFNARSAGISIARIIKRVKNGKSKKEV